jgi:hypothetical protein
LRKANAARQLRPIRREKKEQRAVLGSVAEDGFDLLFSCPFPAQKEKPMLYRTLALLAAVTFVLLVCQPGFAVDKADKTHKGKVILAGNGKLTMTDKDGGNQHVRDVAPDAVITCDGKPCKLEDLKPCTFIKVTMKDEKTVSQIEARTKEK